MVVNISFICHKRLISQRQFQPLVAFVVAFVRKVCQAKLIQHLRVFRVHIVCMSQVTRRLFKHFLIKVAFGSVLPEFNVIFFLFYCVFEVFKSFLIIMQLMVALAERIAHRCCGAGGISLRFAEISQRLINLLQIQLAVPSVEVRDCVIRIKLDRH